MRYWLDFGFAYRNIIRHKRRSGFAVGAVAFGVIALILATGFIEYVFWGLREATIESQLGHIQISRPGYQESGKADPFSFLLPVAIPQLKPDESSLIKAVAPRLSFSGLISHGETTLSFIGTGIDPHKEDAFGNSLRISTGEKLAHEDIRSVLLGEGLARNLGVEVGDHVILLANTASGGINAIEVTVRGFFSTVSKSYDDSALRIHIVAARQLLRTQGSHVWVVLLTDTGQTDDVLERVRHRMGKGQFEIVPWYALSDFYNKTVSLYEKQIQGMSVIIALIILLSITNTMTVNVMERIGEIGTSMALGVKPAGIVRLFVSEGILIGCLGAITGLLLGLILAYIISNIGIPMPPPPGMTHGYIGKILVTADIAWKSVALAVGTTFVASIYPAWRASRMQIVDALRHNK